jgi:hypothetical protein
VKYSSRAAQLYRQTVEREGAATAAAAAAGGGAGCVAGHFSTAHALGICAPAAAALQKRLGDRLEDDTAEEAASSHEVDFFEDEHAATAATALGSLAGVRATGGFFCVWPV